MARPVYPYELSDPDMSWLVNNFKENNPNYIAVESTCLPIVLIKISDSTIPSEIAGLVAKADKFAKPVDADANPEK